jgi:hypothetical protein
VLALVDEIVTIGIASSEVLRAARDAAGSESAYPELLVIPGFYTDLASILDALQVPFDDPAICWPPDGVRPSQVPNFRTDPEVRRGRRLG